jgi:hypothetical protein
MTELDTTSFAWKGKGKARAATPDEIEVTAEPDPLSNGNEDLSVAQPDDTVSYKDKGRGKAVEWGNLTDTAEPGVELRVIDKSRKKASKATLNTTLQTLLCYKDRPDGPVSKAVDISSGEPAMVGANGLKLKQSTTTQSILNEFSKTNGKALRAGTTTIVPPFSNELHSTALGLR